MENLILNDNTLYERVSPILKSNISEDDFILSTTVATYNNADELYQIMDGDESNSWSSYPYKTSGNFTFNFNKNTLVDALYIKFLSSAFAWRSWVLEAYDGVDWIILHSQTESIDSLFIKFNKVNYSKYRIRSIKSPTGAYVKLSEITLYNSINLYKFTKLLHENLPTFIEDGYDRFIFDENGNMYISKIDGTLIKLFEVSSLSSGDIINKNGFFIKDYSNRELLNLISESDGSIQYDNRNFVIHADSKKENNYFKDVNNTFEVIVDKELDEESESLVANDVVTELINKIMEEL